MWPSYCGGFKIYVDFCFNSDFTTRRTTLRQVDLLAFPPDLAPLNILALVSVLTNFYQAPGPASFCTQRSHGFLSRANPLISKLRANIVPHLPWTRGDFFSLHSAAYVLNRSSCDWDPSNSSQGISPAYGLGLGPLGRQVSPTAGSPLLPPLHPQTVWIKHTVSPAPM